jgi:hypothetical protein
MTSQLHVAFVRTLAQGGLQLECYRRGNISNESRTLDCAI